MVAKHLNTVCNGNETKRIKNERFADHVLQAAIFHQTIHVYKNNTHILTCFMFVMFWFYFRQVIFRLQHYKFGRDGVVGVLFYSS